MQSAGAHGEVLTFQISQQVPPCLRAGCLTDDAKNVEMLKGFQLSARGAAGLSTALLGSPRRGGSPSWKGVVRNHTHGA